MSSLSRARAGAFQLPSWGTGARSAASRAARGSLRPATHPGQVGAQAAPQVLDGQHRHHHHLVAQAGQQAVEEAPASAAMPLLRPSTAAMLQTWYSSLVELCCSTYSAMAQFSSSS